VLEKLHTGLPLPFGQGRDRQQQLGACLTCTGDKQRGHGERLGGFQLLVQDPAGATSVSVGLCRPVEPQWYEVPRHGLEPFYGQIRHPP